MSLLCPRKVGYIVGQSAVYRIETLPILCDKMDGNYQVSMFGLNKAMERRKRSVANVALLLLEES